MAVRTFSSDCTRRLARCAKSGARAQLSYHQCGGARFAASDCARADPVRPVEFGLGTRFGRFYFFCFYEPLAARARAAGSRALPAIGERKCGKVRTYRKRILKLAYSKKNTR